MEIDLRWYRWAGLLTLVGGVGLLGLYNLTGEGSSAGNSQAATLANQVSETVFDIYLTLVVLFFLGQFGGAKRATLQTLAAIALVLFLVVFVYTGLVTIQSPSDAAPIPAWRWVILTVWLFGAPIAMALAAFHYKPKDCPEPEAEMRLTYIQILAFLQGYRVSRVVRSPLLAVTAISGPVEIWLEGRYWFWLFRARSHWVIKIGIGQTLAAAIKDAGAALKSRRIFAP